MSYSIEDREAECLWDALQVLEAIQVRGTKGTGNVAGAKLTLRQILVLYREERGLPLPASQGAA